MKILYDHQTFYQKIGGVSRYFKEIFDCLEDLGCQIKLSCYFSNNMYLEKRKVKKFFPHFQNHKTTIVMQTINQYLSVKEIKKENYDVFHSTQYSPYFVDLIKKKYVITIHDMISEIYNNNPVNTLNKSIIIPKADGIIAISENTKKDILKFYPNIKPEKISVIYHGFSQSNRNLVINKYGNYILFVGQRGDYKNFNIFFDAVIPILQKDKLMNLVCTGTPFSNLELKKIKLAKIQSQCFSAYVSENELFSLYKFAKVFVFPSLYEGFGLPILEAFSNECPVCLSDSSCFPEIAGEAALFFNPKSINSIKKSIEEIIYNQNIANELKVKGKERLKHFSWEKSAKLHLEFYKSII